MCFAVDDNNLRKPNVARQQARGITFFIEYTIEHFHLVSKMFLNTLLKTDYDGITTSDLSRLLAHLQLLTSTVF